MNPLKEVTEVSNDVVYPTTLNDSSVSTNSSAPNEMYAIPVRITTRRRGKRNPQKFRRRNNEHFFMGLGESQSPSRIKARITTRKSQLLEGLPTIGQPNFGPTWNPSICENLRY